MGSGMRLRSIIRRSAIVLALVLIATLAALILSFDINESRDRIEAGFSTALGRTVIFEGPMALDLSLHPTLVLEGLRILNPPWASRPDMIRARRLTVQISLVPLLRREIVMDHILVDGADLLLEEGPNGANNWTFGGGSAPDASPAVESQPLVNVSEIVLLTVRRSTISYRPGPAESPYRVVIAEGSMVPVDERFNKFSIEGTLRNVPFTIELTGGKVVKLLALTEPWPLDGSFSAAGTTLALQGKLIGPHAARSLELDIALQGDRLSALNPLVGTELPSFGPYQLVARVSGSEDGLSVQDLSAKIGDSEFTGALALATTGPRAQLSVALTADTLQLHDFRSGDPAPKRADAMRPLEPFAMPVAALRTFDADVRLKAKNVLVGENRLGELGLTARLQRGLLEVDPFQAEIWGGGIHGSLQFDVREAVAKATFEVKAQSLDYGQALESLNVTSQVSGSTDLEVSFRGQGATVREFLNHVAVQMNVGPSSLILGKETSREGLPIGIGNARVTVAEGGPVKALVEGSFRDKPVSVRLITGTLARLFSDSETWPLNLSARAVQASLDLKGALRSEAQGMGFALAVALRGRRLSSLDPGLPPKGPYILDAKLTKKGGRYTVTDLVVRLGGSDIAGSLRVDTEGQRPRLTATLTSQRVNLADLSTPGDVAIPVKALRAFDGNLNLLVERVRAGSVQLADIALRAELKGGRFALAPFKGRLFDKKLAHGVFGGTLDLDASSETPTVSLKATLKELNYGHLLKSFQLTDRVEGAATMHLVFSGEGPSLFTLLAQSSFGVNTDEMRMILQPKEETRSPVLFTHARIFAAKGGPLQLRVRGRVKDTPFTLTSSSGRLKGLIAQAGPWPLMVSARLPKASLRLDGHLHLPLDGENFTFTIAADSERLRDLAPWIAGLPDFGPFEATSSLAQTREGYGLTDFKGRLAGSDVAGSLALVTTGRRPRIVGKLTSETFELQGVSGKRSGPSEAKDHSILHEVEAPVEKLVSEVREVATEVAGADQNRSASSEAEHDRVFPDFTLPVDALRIVDLDLDWKVKHVQAPATELGDLAFRVKLEDGELTVAPFRGTLWGGVIDGSLELDVAGTIPTVALKTTMNELDYGRLFTSLGVPDLATGRADLITIDLQGRGHTLHEVLSRANGQYEVVDRRFQLTTKYIDLWASGLIRGAMTAAWQSERVIQFNCVLGYFDVVNGVVQSDAMLFDTTRLTVAGIGTLDLGTEKIDVVLTPRPKDPALISLAHTVRLTGQLSDPDVSSDKLRIAESGGWALLGLAAGPIGWALVTPHVMGTTLGTDEQNPCAEAMASKLHTAKKVTGMRRGFFDRVKDFFEGADTSAADGSDTKPTESPY